MGESTRWAGPRLAGGALIFYCSGMRIVWTLLLGTALLVGTSMPAAGALDPVEQRLARSASQNAGGARILLEAAVNTNSGTLNLEGVRQVGQLFMPPLTALGFEARWVDGAAWQRAGHLVAERHPKGARLKVLLIGHLDTVFEADSPFQRWEALDDSLVKGPGVSDMKGGDVILLLALQALKETGTLDRIAVTVVLTGDEEKMGRPLELSRHDLIQAADWADVALAFEDGDGDWRSAVTGRRGSGGWTLTVHGTPAHSSQIWSDPVGSGAIYEAGRILAAIQDSCGHEPLLTVNPGVILGGTAATVESGQSRGTAFGKSNVVAETTFVAGDLRYISAAQRDAARDRIRRIVSRHLPGTTATIEFDDGYPPLEPTAGNQQLLGWLDQVSRDLGDGPVTADDPARVGAADISFAGGRVLMALDGLGLAGTGGHTVEETGNLRTLPRQAARVAVLLKRLADSPPR